MDISSIGDEILVHERLIVAVSNHRCSTWLQLHLTRIANRALESYIIAQSHVRVLALRGGTVDISDNNANVVAGRQDSDPSEVSLIKTDDDYLVDWWKILSRHRQDPRTIVAMILNEQL